jgi:hypothetical protein
MREIAQVLKHQAAVCDATCSDAIGLWERSRFSLPQGG